MLTHGARGFLPCKRACRKSSNSNHHSLAVGGLNMLHKISIREVSVWLLQCLSNTEGLEETMNYSSLQNPVQTLNLNLEEPKQLQYL